MLQVKDEEVLKPLGVALNEPIKRKKVPRRVLHFSDGTLEEYSTDEDEDMTDSRKDTQIAQANPVRQIIIHLTDTTDDKESCVKNKLIKISLKYLWYSLILYHGLQRQMTWFPWMWYQAATAASQTLQVCDYLGESLASFFGITTPKYQYEIEEYHRIVAEASTFMFFHLKLSLYHAALIS